MAFTDSDVSAGTANERDAIEYLRNPDAIRERFAALTGDRTTTRA